MDKYTKYNQTLLEELKKHEKDSKEYKNIVAKIMENNVRLVQDISSKFHSSSIIIDREDLFTEGLMGLYKAIDKFDPNKGVLFASFAGECVKNEILMLLRREKVLNRIDIISIEKTMEISKNGDELKLENILISEEDFEEDLFRKEEIQSNKEWIKNNLGALTPLQQKLIKLKYFSGKGAVKQCEIADILKISRPNVTKNEKKALEKLRLLYMQSDIHDSENKQEAEDFKEPNQRFSNKEKKELKSELKNLILSKLSPLASKIMISKYYSQAQKTSKQVAQELMTTWKYVDGCSYKSNKKLCKIYNQTHEDNQLSHKDIVDILNFKSTEKGI